MIDSQLDISPRKQQLKKEYERLQREYSELVAKRDDMVLCEAPRLEAMYMEAVGQLQYEILMLDIDIALLKYERDLIQAYLNRGEEPDEEAIKVQVEQSAQAYQENLHEEEEKIKKAKAYVEEHKEENSKEKDAEKLSLKQLYKRLVHRLHPDLHPEQTEWERELFLRVQEAYRNQDLEKLKQLEAELDAGMPSTAAENDSIEVWEERIQKLKEQIAAIRKEIETLENDFPFTYRERLYDQEWISANQQELRAEIHKLEKEKARLEKIVEMMRQKVNEE